MRIRVPMVIVALLALVGAGASCSTEPAATRVPGEAPGIPASAGVPMLKWLQERSLVSSSSSLSIGVVIFSDIAAMTTPGKLPAKNKFKLEASKFGSAGGQDGVMVVAAAGDLDLAPQKAYKKIIASVPGSKGTGNWQNDLGGAVACVVTDAGKAVNVTVKGKGAQTLGTGSGAGFVLARIPLTALGLSVSDFLDLCKQAPDLIRELL